MQMILIRKEFQCRVNGILLSNFLSSDDIDNIKEGYTPVKVKIPSYWSSYSLDGQNFSGSGYGTYHLELILPHNFREPLGMHLPGVDVAYKLFVDGKLIKECGVIGKNKREEELTIIL